MERIVSLTHSSFFVIVACRPPQVPKGFSSQPETIDAALCRRVATISRVPVPAVSFQLGGLVAAIVLDCVGSHRFVNLAKKDRTLFEDEECRRKGVAEQWLFVDELDSGLRESGPGKIGVCTGERCDERAKGGFSKK